MEPPPTPETSPPQTARAVIAIVAGVMLLCCALTGGLLVFVRAKAREAGFPHAGRSEAVAALRAVGPDVILAEARTLTESHPAGTELIKHRGDPLPQGIGQLPLIYVAVDVPGIRIKISGMGDWSGFIIPLDDVVPERAELVEPGIYWIDI